MCEHLADAAAGDIDTKQRALSLAQKWQEMALEAERRAKVKDRFGVDVFHHRVSSH